MDSVESNHTNPSSNGDNTSSLPSNHLQNPQIEPLLGSSNPVPNSESNPELKRLMVPENGVSSSSGGEDETTSRGRRRSRWDPQPTDSSISNPIAGEGGNGTRKRKSRWADDDTKTTVGFQLPDFMKGIEFDPEIQVLNTRLLEISRILQSGMPLDDREEGNRSPSPEPIYDNMGIRVNTREYRARERLNRERQEIISQIIKKNPAFKPPADYRPPKLQKKLYIPEKEYPGYGFMGLIIGPRGNTQKRMQSETGAKIVIRGKGSVKEGRFKQTKALKYDPSENEDLHVLVEAETQESLDAAVGMIEKLLQPVDEVQNEHKRQQLKELATLNGTIRDGELCRMCGETGHRQFACPTARTNTFKSDVLCKICGDGGHPTIDCPVKGTIGKKMDDEYQNFLAEVGGTVPESSLKQSTTLALGPGSDPPWAKASAHPGLGSNPVKPPKEYDETNLYIGFLPPMLEDNGLVSLFSSFGEIETAKVIKDRESGMSKGFGFVKYADVHMANAAIHAMNGYRLEGKTLAVRIAGKQPPPIAPPAPPGPQPLPSGNFHSQQYANGGQMPNPPPVGYSTAPVPWGPPVPSYYPYAPPPGQHYSPYGMHYPPPPPPPPHLPQAPPPGTAPQNPSYSESQQSYPPGVQADNGAPASSGPPNVYMTSVTGMPEQPRYMSYYPSYYNAVPPPMPVSSTDDYQSMSNLTWANKSPVLTSDHSHGIGNNAPWVPHVPMPPTVGYSQSMGNGPWHPEPPAQPPAENPSGVGDSEYEKFMAEIKYEVGSEVKLPSGEV